MSYEWHVPLKTEKSKHCGMGRSAILKNCISHLKVLFWGVHPHNKYWMSKANCLQNIDYITHEQYGENWQVNTKVIPTSTNHGNTLGLELSTTRRSSILSLGQK